MTNKEYVITKKTKSNGTIARVAIVLDRSGSMESCRDATISGFNEYIAGIRDTAEREELPTRITLTTFNGDVAVHCLNAPISRLKPLTRGTYVPDGTTAMLDALGHTIDRLDRSRTPRPAQRITHDAQRLTTTLVCVISDGYENASRRFTYADIAERIQQLTASGAWSFTYLGSNQDLSKVSADLHIPAGNTANYCSTPEGTDAAFRKHTKSSSRHLANAARGAPTPANFYAREEDRGDADPHPETRNNHP
jgi:hypothetical protein